jgi:transposase
MVWRWVIAGGQAFGVRLGCGMSMYKPYPSDLTDEQWELVEPVITAWKARHPSVSGHQGKYAMREIVNAILYQNRTGCQWEFLPHDMPPPGAVKYYFYLWRDEGTDQDIHDLLRWQLREKRKRLADPSLVVLDTQSIHVAVGVPATTTGRDAAKKCRAEKDAWPWMCWASSSTASSCPPPHTRTPLASPFRTVSPSSATR